MELLSVIRRWAFRDRLSIREISRRTGLSRNTIRKYLQSDVVEPAFKVPEMLFEAHSQGFRVFRGVPRRGIYDNMRTAVNRVGVGKKRQVNAPQVVATDAAFCHAFGIE